jgi:large subunit ribosomal protein L37e
MTKGTASKGKRSGKQNHIYCRRCGERTYHKKKKICSHCGYGKSTKLKKRVPQKKVRKSID